MTTKLFLKEVNSKRKEFAPTGAGANSFLSELNSIEMRGKYENGRVASPENALISFNMFE